ncbi:MAG: hypothetical protein QM775_05370 [Pirellulales bacterium]
MDSVATTRNAEFLRRRDEIEARAAEVQRRCEALKRHWNELIAREQVLDRRSEELETRKSDALQVSPSSEAEHVTADEPMSRSVVTETSVQRNEQNASDNAAEPVVAIVEDQADKSTSDAETLAASHVDDRYGENEAVNDETSGEAASEVAPDHVEDESAAEEAPSSRSSESGESAADVLRRLGMATALDEDVADSAQPQRSPSPPPPPQPAPRPAGHAEGEDDSLNDYMAQLFQRLGVRQGDAPAAPAPQQRSEPAAPSSSPSRAAAPKPQPSPTAKEEKPQAPLNPAEFRARSVAAEKKSDLNALRELANVDARAAVANHQIKTTEKASQWKGYLAMCCGLTSVAGVVVTVLGYANALPVTAGGIAAMLIFGTKSLRLRRKATKSTRSLDDVLQRSAAKMRGDGEAKSE